MKPLIVANWKMNPATLIEAKRLFDPIVRGIKNVKNIVVVVCPPFSYLTTFDSRLSILKLGGQDCFWEARGAFTGEISVKMLKSSGCQYVILGHSERRKYLKETDEMVNKKIKMAINSGLEPILCIANLAQLKKSLRGIKNEVVVAYEPIFAIGTGKPCTIEKAKKMRKMIKYSTVLYGGSVNSKNAKDYIKEAGFQGLLVGGASLSSQEFLGIIKSID